MGLRDEIAEQPASAERLLRLGRPAIEHLADAIRSAGSRAVFIAARGTSDHAAIYAQYVLGVRNRMPVGLAAPSIRTIYGVEPAFEGSVVLGISQSGASPDIVEVVSAARRQGAVTAALTNEPGSALAQVADHVIDLGAGPELAIAATKTYTAELLAIAMLSAAIGDTGGWSELATAPTFLAAALDAEADARSVAAAFPNAPACVILGRGFEYATAREWALKLKELTRLVADPYSAADVEHGPLALLEPGFPVLAIATSGAASSGLDELLSRLVAAFGVDLLVVSDRPAARDLGRWSLPARPGVPDWLTPLTSIVPCQLFAYHLARARRLDPDAPRNIAKVTRTR